MKNEIRGIISVDSLLHGTVYYSVIANDEQIQEVKENYKGNYQDY